MKTLTAFIEVSSMDEESQSIFIDDMVLHVSVYNLYKTIFRNKGYRALRNTLKDRWYSKSEQNKVIHKIHEDLCQKHR